MALALAGAVGLTGCGDEDVQGPPTFRYGEMAAVRVDVDGQRVPMDATVRVIEAGSPQALTDAGLTTLDLTRKQPFYVRVAYANPTGRAFTTAVDQQFRPRQSNGAYAVRLDIISDKPFPPCSDQVPPASFASLGGTADACLVVLAEEGTTLTSVEWTFPDRSTLAIWKAVP